MPVAYRLTYTVDWLSRAMGTGLHVPLLQSNTGTTVCVVWPLGTRMAPAAAVVDAPIVNRPGAAPLTVTVPSLANMDRRRARWRSHPGPESSPGDGPAIRYRNQG